MAAASARAWNLGSVRENYSLTKVRVFLWASFLLTGQLLRHHPGQLLYYCRPVDIDEMVEPSLPAAFSSARLLAGAGCGAWHTSVGELCVSHAACSAESRKQTLSRFLSKPL